MRSTVFVRMSDVLSVPAILTNESPPPRFEQILYPPVGCGEVSDFPRPLRRHMPIAAEASECRCRFERSQIKAAWTKPHCNCRSPATAYGFRFPDDKASVACVEG